MRLKLALFCFVILCHGFYSTSAQLRIVCIGNSITQGKIGLKSDSSYEYSYRPWLWEKLIQTGFNVDMVGFHRYFFDERSGNLIMHFETNGVTFDRDSEAYYGITSSGFLNGSSSQGWTEAPLPDFRKRINDPDKGYTPDVALIHLGTNDADSTTELVDVTRNNIIEIIRVLRERNPSVVVIVAKLITGWKKINTKIDGLCIETSTTKSPVIVVDMATGFVNDPKLVGTMTYDYVHPNKVGQLFMMQRWYSTILANLQDAQPPSLKGKPVLAKRSGSEVTISWPAASDNFGIKSYEISIDGKLVNQTSQDTTYTFSDFEKRRAYKVSVKAKDWSGNSSNSIVARI